MLKISKLADYAVIVLGALTSGEAATASDLARQTHLPPATVAKVLKLLAKGGLLQTTRGATGGYRLAQPASQIRASDILIAIDGPVQLTDCVGDHKRCALSACGSRGRWDPVNRAIETALNNVTLADLTTPFYREAMSA